jgi:hypothetical protein
LLLGRSQTVTVVTGPKGMGAPGKGLQGAPRGPREGPRRKNPRKGPGNATEVVICVLEKRRKEKKRIKGSFRIC